MKKVLLLATLLIGLLASAQRTAATSIEKAKPFLVNDPCNNTGIAWVEGALLLEPNNIEAKKIIKNCNDIKFNDAIASLKNDITNSKSIDVLTKMIINHTEYDTEEANYLLAKANLENGPSHIVKKYIDKAITFNINNIDYRWIRVRCSMIFGASSDSYKQAVSDLNFMIEKGVKTATVYSNLGLAEYELGSAILRFTEVKKNDSYTDDTSLEKQQQKSILEETILHYNNSKINYQKGIDIGKEGFKDNVYRIKEIDKQIPDLQERLKKLS